MDVVTNRTFASLCTSVYSQILPAFIVLQGQRINNGRARSRRLILHKQRDRNTNVRFTHSVPSLRSVLCLLNPSLQRKQSFQTSQMFVLIKQSSGRETLQVPSPPHRNPRASSWFTHIIKKRMSTHCTGACLRDSIDFKRQFAFKSHPPSCFPFVK